MTHNPAHSIASHNAAEHARGMSAGLETMVRDFMAITMLPNDAYNAVVEGQSSIGAHVRHVLEFLQVLADNVGGSVIDYESRAHNAAYETNAQAVATILPQLQHQLDKALATHGILHPLLLRETVAMGGKKITVTTSLGRETLFVLQHALHHLAIIKMQATAMNITMDSSCGVAIATQQYRGKSHG